ncbi:MAG: hypothetical protein AB1644_07545 [Candidatus Zixiibacteriota bacterium]
MNFRNSILLTAILVLVVVATHGETKASDELILVPWSEIRAEIATYLCVKVDSHPDGTIGSWIEHTGYERCTPGNATPALARAVKKTLKMNFALLVGVQPRQVGLKFQDTLPIDVQTRNLQEAYFGCDLFLRPLLRSLAKELASQGLACPDLPALEPRPVRTVLWAEFARYLSVYAWPDEVYTPTDSLGRPTGKPISTYHICSGLNGIDDAIADPDEFLVYVACTIAMFNPDFEKLASTYFKKLRTDSALHAMTGNSERTKYLREQLPARLAADRKLREVAMKRVKKYAEDLAIRFES